MKMSSCTMVRYFKRTKWYWLLGLVLSGALFNALFPAGNTATRLRILQRQSNVNLSAISKWTLARQECGEKEWSQCMTNLTFGEKSCLLNALTGRVNCSYNISDWQTSGLCYNALSNYVILTNQEPVRVTLNNAYESVIVAHEKFGLWSDDTVAMYLKNFGVVRMKGSECREVLRGKKKRLKYVKRTYLWTLEENE